MERKKQADIKEPRLRKVMIGCPTYDWKVDVRWVNSLMETLRSAPPGVAFFPIFQPGDALVERARNDLVRMAVEAEVDDLVFVDADVVWRASDMTRILGHGLEVVGGLYRQHTDQQRFVLVERSGAEPKDGVVEVLGTGCGFLRLSRRALRRLWDSSRAYTDGTVTGRVVFEVQYDRKDLVSEDIALCRKWRKLGGKVFVDTRGQLGHIGQRLYVIEAPKNMSETS